jgi:hypothetical protein
MDMNALSYWQQLDLLVSQWKEQRRTGAHAYKSSKKPEKVKLQKAQIEPIEWLIVFKMQTNVTFPPATGPKRFINRLTVNSELSDEGRRYLAYCAHRFRRQWTATAEEFAWIVQWLKPYQEPK